MALQKEVKTQFGNNATYWRILEYRMNFVMKTADFAIGGYLDKDKRDAGMQPLMVTGVSFDPQNFPFTDEVPILRSVYEHIKRGYKDQKGTFVDTFVNSTDV